MRFTKNPGELRQGNGNLSMRLARLIARFIVVSSVKLPRTISTRGIKATGLKKCRPTKRAGCCRAELNASSWIDEVFVARIASSFKRGSSAAKTLRLTSARSTIASITTSASPTVVPSTSARKRAKAASRRAGSLMRSVILACCC